MYLDAFRIDCVKEQDPTDLSKLYEQIRPYEPEMPALKPKKKKPARGGGRP